MGSEDQVLELMVLLDTGLQQANKIEEKLTEYERKLQVITFCSDIVIYNWLDFLLSLTEILWIIM